MALKEDGHSVCYVTVPQYVAALKKLGVDAVVGFGPISGPQGGTHRDLRLWEAATPGVVFWRALGTPIGLTNAPARVVIRAVAAATIVPAVVDTRPDVLLCDAKIAAACGDTLERAIGSDRIVAIRTELPIGDALPYMDLVLCPEELELPRLRASTQGRYYCEPSLFTRRSKRSTPSSHSRPDSCLIYCSFGTQSMAYDGAAEVLDAVVNAFDGRASIRLIVAGNHLTAHLRTKVRGRNVHIYRTVDQFNTLAKATLAIVHGGLGSVKEAVYQGVPMLVIPFAFDQMPNAERVAAHELGVAIRPCDVTSRHLHEATRDMLSSMPISSRMAAMQARFHEAEAERQAYKHIVERLNETSM
jgi:UDP:flavonoid glycosyltransferase YjiC (YdhE family)